MSAAKPQQTKPQLATVTTEEFKARSIPQVDATPVTWYEAIQMAVQKSLTPSIPISSATISICIILTAYLIGITSWAVGTSKDVSEQAKKIEKLQEASDMDRVYKEDVGRKLGEVKAILQTLQINEQTKKLLQDLIDEQLTEKERKR